MIIRTNSQRVIITNKDLEKKFHTKEYEGIEFTFKNMTLKQEMDMEAINQGMEDKGSTEQVKNLVTMVHKVLTENLVEVKGLVNENGDILSVSTELINDLIDYNYEFSFAVVMTYFSLKFKDKKK